MAEKVTEEPKNITPEEGEILASGMVTHTPGEAEVSLAVSNFCTAMEMLLPKSFFKLRVLQIINEEPNIDKQLAMLRMANGGDFSFLENQSKEEQI